MLIAGCALCLFRPWDGFFYYRDITLCQYPLFSVLRQLWKSDVFPLWDCCHGFGQPLVADPVFMALYPPTQLLRILDPAVYMNIFIPLHWFLCVLGLVVLLRRFSLTVMEACAGALLFGLSGAMVSLTVQPVPLLSTAYLPWLLYFVIRASESRTWWNETAGACCLVFILISGDLTGILSTMIILVLFAFTWPSGKRMMFAGLARILLPAILVCGPQLLPSMELSRESGRSIGFSYERISTYSLMPIRLTETMLPRIFGDPMSASSEHYRGYAIFGKAPYLPSIFLGGVSFLILLLLGLHEKFRSSLPLILVSAFFIAMSFGKYSEFHHFFISVLPLLKAVRFPEKYFVYAAFLLCPMASFGLCRLVVIEKPWLKSCLIATLIALIVLYLIFPPIRMSLYASILPVGIFCCGKLMRRRIITACGIAVMLGIMLLEATGLNPKGPRLPAGNDVFSKTGMTAIARFEDPPNTRLFPPNDSPLWGIQWDRATLNYATASEFCIQTPFENDVAAIYTSRQRNLHDLFNSLPLQSSCRLARLYSCRWIISAAIDPSDVESASVLTTSVTYSPSLFLARLKGDIQEPAAIRDGVESPTGWEESVRLILDDSFDWRLRSLIEGEIFHSHTDQSSPAGFIERESGAAGALECSVNMHRPGYLVINQSFYPGWTAAVDGRKTEVHRANLLAMAVPITTGRHTVNLTFQPQSLRLGLFMFSLGLAWITVNGFLKWGSKGRKSPPEQFESSHLHQ